MHKILIVEDEPPILLGLSDELRQYYQIVTATNGQQGLEKAFNEHPELILLDLILPDIDGFELCRRFKEEGIDSAIIILTARDQLVDKVKGLELGADDYMTKPFSLRELQARIRAILRRRQKTASVEEFKDSILEINFRSYKATRKKKALKLSALEFKLLRFLIFRKGEVTSRQELLEQVWGYEIPPSTRTVDVHILSLRKKIGKNYIATVHGEGYRFEVNA